MASKKSLPILPIVLGGLFVCCLVFYVGLWGIGKYIETSVLLDQLDGKVNGTQSITKTEIEPLSAEQREQKERLDQLERFLFLATDREGRRVLSVPDMEYVMKMNGWDWTNQWNELSPITNGTSTLWTQSNFQWRIPYNPAWRNAQYTIAPYEFDGNDILFGRMIVSEMGGVFREARFSLAPEESIEQLLADPKNVSVDCSLTEQIPPTVINVGSKRVVRIIQDTCERGSIAYVIPGKGRNYIFQTSGDEALLKWVVERFEES